MPLTDVPTLEASIEIDATPEQVWALVSDLRNMPRWSPQCAKTFVRGGGPVEHGSRMVNINRRGLLVWPTQAKVVRFEEGREVAFRVKDNMTVWSYTLEPLGTGTRLVERREAPQGISDISVRLTKAVLGGVDNFTRELVAGMNSTLHKIKAEAEAA
jgi:uncharacterized protein YndB with AHSA1/START domain